VGANWRDRQLAALRLLFLPRLAVVFPCLADDFACAAGDALGCPPEGFETFFEGAALAVLLGGFFSAAV